jgi:hypothetical protein
MLGAILPMGSKISNRFELYKLPQHCLEKYIKSVGNYLFKNDAAFLWRLVISKKKINLFVKIG